MKKFIVKTFIVAAIVFPLSAFAVPIVDTSPNDPLQGGSTLSSEQWLAGEFTTTQGWSIDSIYGWMAVFGAGTGTIALYDANGPAGGAELFSSIMTVASNSAPELLGVDNLDWVIDAGTYWVSFEVRSGQTMSGAMPHPSDNPLGGYQFWNGTSWIQALNSDFGVEINASAVAVPEPGTLALLGAGCLIAGLARRRTL